MPGELSLGTAYASVELRLNRLEAQVAQANQTFNKFSQNTESKARRIGQTFDTIGTRLTASVAAPLLALGTAAVATSVRFDSLKRGLTAVAGSSQEAERQLKRLKEVARLPGLGMEEAIQGSIRLQSAGFSAELAERALKGFGNAIATVGGGKAELEGVAVALGQMASKGKVFAEEVNQLNERVPQIRKAMEAAFGTSNTELLQKAGITAQQFVDGVTRYFEKQKQVTSGAQNSLENLQDSAKRALTSIGDVLLPHVTKAADSAATALESIGEKFSGLPKTAQESILGAGGMVVALSAGLLVAGKLLTTVVGIGEALTKIKAMAPALVSAFSSGALIPHGPEGIGRWVFNWARNITGQAASDADEAARRGMAEGRVAFSAEMRAGRRGPARVTAKDPFEEIRRLIQGIGIADAQKKADAEARKRAAEARRALAAQYRGEALQMQVDEAMFGKYDADKFLEYLKEVARLGREDDQVLQDLATSWRDSLTEEAEKFGGALKQADILDNMFQGTDPAAMQNMLEGIGSSVNSLAGSIVSTTRATLDWGAAMKQTLGEKWLAAAEDMAQAITEVLPFGPHNKAMQRSFDWVADFATNLSEEFSDSFSRGLDRAFGKNPFGRAIARSLSKMLSSVLDNVFLSGIQTEGGGGQGGGKGVNFAALLGKIGLGAVLGGVGSLFGGLFAEGGTAPGRRWSIVGERGPEIIAPAQAMRVLPAAGMGGVTINMGGVSLANSMDVQRVSREIAWQVRRELRAEVGS